MSRRGGGLALGGGAARQIRPTPVLTRPAAPQAPGEGDRSSAGLAVGVGEAGIRVCLGRERSMWKGDGDARYEAP